MSSSNLGPRPVGVGKPPPPSQYNWAQVVERAKQSPGEIFWVENVSASTGTWLRKRYGIETECRGVKNGRAAFLYFRWPKSEEES